MNNYLISITILPLLLLINLDQQQEKSKVNYYDIPTNLIFNDSEYNLSWSSHPNNNYYKQEYLTKGESEEHFNNMVTIEFLVTDIPIKDVVQNQIMTLLERKKTDIICNYQVIKNQSTGDYLLDFVLSESDNNHINIVEWDAYHYKSYTDKAGHKGALLFAVSHRVYNGDTNDFLKNLKAYRIKAINKILLYPIPQIQVN